MTSAAASSSAKLTVRNMDGDVDRESGNVATVGSVDASTVASAVVVTVAAFTDVLEAWRPRGGLVDRWVWRVLRGGLANGALLVLSAAGDSRAR